MTYFLEIMCMAATVGCLVNTTPSPPIERYYQTKRACDQAALIADKKYNTNKDDWRLRCLPIKR